jgi:uncharacterized protein (DUF2237 family)
MLLAVLASFLSAATSHVHVGGKLAGVVRHGQDFGSLLEEGLLEEGSVNIYGEPLQTCSKPGMALSGFTRNGKCEETSDDQGSHHICINLNSTVDKNGKGLNFCGATGQPNWCDEADTCMGSSGQCPRKDWCVCQWAFLGYIQKAGGCAMVQEIVCDAVNGAAIVAYNQQARQSGGKEIRDALDCLSTRCCMGAKKCPAIAATKR